MSVVSLRAAGTRGRRELSRAIVTCDLKTLGVSPVGGELPIVPQPRVNRRVVAVIQPSPNPYPRQGFSQGQERA